MIDTIQKSALSADPNGKADSALFLIDVFDGNAV